MNILRVVIAHKDFEWNDLPEEELKSYQVFTPNSIKTNISNVTKFEEVTGYDNRIYSELSHLKYIRDNISNFDWIHINHYRRRLIVPNYNNFYCADPLILIKTNKEFYEIYHNVNDLNIMTDIIQEKLSSNFQIEWIKLLNNNYMIPYNMVSISKEVFYEWIDISTMLIDEFKKRRNFYNYEQIKKYIETHQKEYSHCNDGSERIQYNIRVFAYLWERITSMYFQVYAKFHNNLPFIKMPILPAFVKLLDKHQEI